MKCQTLLDNSLKVHNFSSNGHQNSLWYKIPKLGMWIEGDHHNIENITA